jgi:hypothetical protein
VRWKLVLVATVSALGFCGCSTPPAAIAHPSLLTTTSAGLSPLTGLVSHCGKGPPQRYELGGAQIGSMPGNPTPVAISLTEGSAATIWAHFAQRHLGPFRITGTEVRVVCGVNVPGPGGGPAEILEARTPGTVLVSTTTDDCDPCAGLGFTAKINIVASSGSASASTAPRAVTALARIRTSVQRTEAAGTAHFVSQTWLAGIGPSQHIASAGDVQFRGPDVSLMIRVRSSASSNAPLSAQIALGKDFYTRYVSPSGSPAPWSRGRTRQAYPYLGAVEPEALTNYRGPVKAIGKNVVNGYPATEYALSIPADDQVLPLSGSKTQHLNVRPFTFDVWLNRTGAIVRTTAIQIAEDNGATYRSKTVVTLSQFGEPLHIVAPKLLAAS